VQVNAGQILYHQHEDSDSIYVVLNGRLRSITEGDTTFNLFREHGLDESIGELEVLSK
jgi:lysophospholipid hydrolase